MGMLHVRVELPESVPRAYAFDTFPVRIGRGGDNELVVDDPSVPRALCVAWVEGDGLTVRVEERPGLRNPLISGRTRVSGGISGKRLFLRVGAVRLNLSTEADGSGVSRKKGGSIVVLGLAATVLLAAVLGRGPTASKNTVDVFEMLPKSPGCASPVPTCAGETACNARARLLRERGLEVLSRPKSALSERVDAVAMLRDAAGMTRDSGLRAEVKRELAREEAALTRAYQQEIVRLRDALNSGDKKAARASAVALKRTVGSCDRSLAQRLDRIVAANREEVQEQ